MRVLAWCGLGACRAGPSPSTRVRAADGRSCRRAAAGQQQGRARLRRETCPSCVMVKEKGDRRGALFAYPPHKSSAGIALPSARARRARVAMALSALSGDEQGILFVQLCNVLDPGIAVALSSVNNELRTATWVPLEQLKSDHEAAAALCHKLGHRNCKELREAKVVYWFYKGLTADEMKLLGTCLLYTSPSPRDLSTSRMPSSA